MNTVNLAVQRIYRAGKMVVWRTDFQRTDFELILSKHYMACVWGWFKTCR